MQGKPDRFKLNLRCSDEKSSRWDKSFIFNQLMTQTTRAREDKGQTGIQKMWVCGPPLMEEIFDKILFELCPYFDLNF
jgi:hypothetical protein